MSYNEDWTDYNNQSKEKPSNLKIGEKKGKLVKAKKTLKTKFGHNEPIVHGKDVFIAGIVC